GQESSPSSINRHKPVQQSSQSAPKFQSHVTSNAIQQPNGSRHPLRSHITPSRSTFTSPHQAPNRTSLGQLRILLLAQFHPMESPPNRHSRNDFPLALQNPNLPHILVYFYP